MKKSDCELVKDYTAGNDNALAILLARHKKKVYSYIYGKVNDGELAEDLFQDVFIKVIQTLKGGKYYEDGKFLPWVLRISHNIVIDHFRANTKMKVLNENNNFSENRSVFDTVKLCDKSIEDVLINEQLISDLRRLIDFLPTDQKEVLELRFYNNLSFKEISETTGVSINTSLGRMRYALINLRKIIEKNKLNFV